MMHKPPLIQKKCRTCQKQIVWNIVDGHPELGYFYDADSLDKCRHLCPLDKDHRIATKIQPKQHPQDIILEKIAHIENMLTSSKDFSEAMKNLDQQISSTQKSITELKCMVSNLLDRRYM